MTHSLSAPSSATQHEPLRRLASEIRDSFAAAVQYLDAFLDGIPAEGPAEDAQIRFLRDQCDGASRMLWRDRDRLLILQQMAQALLSADGTLYRHLNSQTVNHFYEYGGDVVGEQIALHCAQGAVWDLINAWARAGCPDGYTLRALLSHPDAPTRASLASRAHLARSAEQRRVWLDVILRRFLEEDRSYKVLSKSVEVLVQHFPEDAERLLRETKLPARIFRHRRRDSAVDDLVLLIFSGLSYLNEDEVALLLERYRAEPLQERHHAVLSALMERFTLRPEDLEEAQDLYTRVDPPARRHA